MRYLLIIMLLCFHVKSAVAQDDLRFLLISGIADTRTFTSDYIKPGVEGIVYNRSSGWYQTAKVKDPLSFEFSVIGNISVDLGDQSSFVMDTRDYENVRFPDGEISRSVATILGNNATPVDVVLGRGSTGDGAEVIVELPQGLSASGIKVLPTYFLQARLGIFKGTEIKARYFPTRKYGDVNLDIYGGAIQHEFTSWLAAPDLFPVAVSGQVAYSRMDGTYEFTEEEFIEGSNQRLKSEINFWLFSAIVSTNFPVFNLYGGIGFIDGSSRTDLLGTFRVIDDTEANSLSITDPFSVSHDISGIKANIGLTLRLGLFKVHADYNFQEYNTISAGVHIGM